MKEMQMKLKTIFFGCILMTVAMSHTAQALPLFGETAGTIRNGILTLYRDDANPNKVYFFPNSTKFSKDSGGIPLFNFVYWDLANADKGGAYFAMTTHLASDDAQQAALDTYMKENPGVEIAVLSVKSSSVGLQTTAANAQPLADLYKEFNFAKVAGRAEDEIGINAVLTPVGAKAFKALLTKAPGGGLLNMQYCYKVQGYAPNMKATIVVDMRRVYDYFEASHSGGWGWFGWNITKATETLRDQRAIVVSMEGGDAKEWEYLQTISETITARLFKPELSASPNIPQAPSNRLFRFGGGSIHKEELKTETWHWDRRDLEERDFCTNIVLKDLEQYRDKLIVSADSN
jgi:hypothetical protein